MVAMSRRKFWGTAGLKYFYRSGRLLLIGGLLLVVGLVWLWWAQVYESPQNVFWGMFENSLATTGVTRHIVESVDNESLNEYVQLELGAHNLAHSISTLTEQNGSVTTETIGTPKADYTRYTNFKLPSAEPQVDLSSILNVWGESTITAANNDPIDHLFGQILLGIVPMANVSASERASLIHQMKSSDVFTTNFKKVQHSHADGRAVYVYQVKIQPFQYAQLMTNFAKLEGFSNVPELTPSKYKQDTPLNIELSINPTSRQLVEISYLGTNHTETYSDYGLEPSISIPTKTITTTQLADRLQALQQP